MDEIPWWRHLGPTDDLEIPPSPADRYFPLASTRLRNRVLRGYPFIGDPIGTIRDLLLKIDSCEKRAVYWKRQFANDIKFLAANGSRSLPSHSHRRFWKSTRHHNRFV